MGINPGNPAFALPPAEDDLVRQIKDLRREMTENLASVASSFKSTVVSLQELVGSQVLPRVASGSASGFYVSPSFVTIASASVVVPTGYTRALVYASGQVTGGNDDALDIAKLYAHITIAGTPGPDTISSMVNVAWASAAAFASASLSGLDGGLISVDMAAKTSGGTTGATAAPWDNASIVSQAIFLR